MRNLLRNILAFVVGALVGGIVNMAIIMVGPMLIPLPAGVNPSDPESLARAMALLQPRHFIAPFLAHALGTLVGALVAWKLAVSQRTLVALLVGVFFLIGGGVATAMLPAAPRWFVWLDLIGAYLPMAWLATVIGERAWPARGAAPPRGAR